MLDATPFANVLMRRDFIRNLERARRSGRRSFLLVFLVVHGVDVVFENRTLVDEVFVGRVRRRLVVAFRRREQLPALGTSGMTASDDSATVRAFATLVFPVRFTPRRDRRHIDRPEPNDVLTVVENEAIRFSRRESKPPPNHLLVKPDRVCRSKQNDAVDIGRVKARRQNVYVDEVFKRRRFASEQVDDRLRALKLVDNRGALVGVRFAGYRRNSRPRKVFERLFDPFRRVDRRAKNEDFFAFFRQFDDLRARAFEDVLPLHQRVDFGRDELAAANVKSGDVELAFPAARLERRQETLRDKFPNPNFVNDFRQKPVGPANPAATEAIRRRGQADESNVGVDASGALQKRSVHSVAGIGDEVRFVDDYQLERPEFSGALVNALNPGDYDLRVGRSFAESRRIKPDRNAVDLGRNARKRLLQKLFHVRQNERSTAELRDRFTQRR